ncbi:MAG TPA: hypothetical protein VML55_22365 [Planctomycetaceae bacterium]|nr:hypothetical protein [Planctomycetaceae bacterium]
MPAPPAAVTAAPAAQNTGQAVARCRCPSCGRRVRGSPGQVGRRVKCPSCQTAFVFRDEPLADERSSAGR